MTPARETQHFSLRRSRGAVGAAVTLATLTDLIAYSIAVPVLPDLTRRFESSPTTIGLLFASFGATLLLVSVPMGAASDRTGRKIPLVAGMLALAGATLLFAFAEQLPMLFAARLVQGAADAVTWGNLGNACHWIPGRETQARETLLRAKQDIPER